MSAIARANGWRGFDTAGSVERVDGGWEYACDGLPSPMGCGSRVVVQRKWTTTGRKKDGWLVVYGLDGPDDDPDVVLAFCASCKAHL